MPVDTGEELAGIWTTPIPEIGVYRLAAKTRMDGKIERDHFQHRLDGTRKVLVRGELESRTQRTDVLKVANKQLKNIFDVIMSAADVSMTTLDGRKADDKVH